MLLPKSGFDIRLKVYGANDKGELNGYSFLLSQNQMLRIQVQLIQFLVRIFLDKINGSFYLLRRGFQNLSYESIIAQGNDRWTF